MDFEVLVNDEFMSVCLDDSLCDIENKSVLSLLNDFQEGKWRHSKFHKFIWDNIAETSLSYTERQSLVSDSHSKLVEAAQSLRLTDSPKDIGKGSELAEIVLYGIMKHHFKALPVVPKIFYKQNSQDNAKGADSVHIVIDNDNQFTIWFGEAKFFNSIDDARLGDIVTSVGNSLNTDKLKRENAIIANVNDLDLLINDPILSQEIKNAISNRESIDSIKPKLHIPILILHQCDITAEQTQISEEYRRLLTEFHIDRATAYYKKHLSALLNIHLYKSITFHLILFPVPSKNKIIDRFLANVKHYKDEAKDD